MIDLQSISTILLNLLFVSLVDMLHLIGGILVVGFCIGILERVTYRFLVSVFGSKGILLTAWIGTPIHELSHAIMCFIFHHRVNKIKLLQFSSRNGILGYVEHQYNPRSLYQRVGNFFIGIAPIIGGAFAIFLCLYFTMPDTYKAVSRFILLEVKGNTVNNLFSISFLTILLFVKDLFNLHQFLQPQFWLFLILSICISSNMALSKADMKGAASGIIALFLFFFILISISACLHIPSIQINLLINRINILTLTMLVVSLMFSLFAVFLSYLVFVVYRFLGNREEAR